MVRDWWNTLRLLELLNLQLHLVQASFQLGQVAGRRVRFSRWAPPCFQVAHGNLAAIFVRIPGRELASMNRPPDRLLADPQSARPLYDRDVFHPIFSMA